MDNRIQQGKGRGKNYRRVCIPGLQYVFRHCGFEAEDDSDYTIGVYYLEFMLLSYFWKCIYSKAMAKYSPDSQRLMSDNCISKMKLYFKKKLSLFLTERSHYKFDLLGS